MLAAVVLCSTKGVISHSMAWSHAMTTMEQVLILKLRF